MVTYARRRRPSASRNVSADHAIAPACRQWAWAALMRHAFDIDVLACPRCGGRLRLIATAEDPDAVRAIVLPGAGTRDLAGRPPPLAPAPNTDYAATATARAPSRSRRRRGLSARIAANRSSRSSALPPLHHHRIGLTRSLSALYPGAGRANREAVDG